KSLNGLTWWTVGLLAFITLADAVSTGTDVVGTLVIPSWNDPSAPLTGGLEIVLALLMTLAAVAALLMFIATIVVFCCWMYRAAANVRSLGETRATITPGWAAGWWFVPF